MGYEYFYGIQADQFTFYRVPKLFFTQEEYTSRETDYWKSHFYCFGRLP